MQKKLVDKLVECSFTERNSVEECTEIIDKVKIDDENECLCSYTTCVVLTVIALAISIGIGDYFAYSRWYLKKDVTHVKFGARTQWNCAQTTI